MIKIWQRWLAYLAIVCFGISLRAEPLSAEESCTETGERRICTIQQELVNGQQVSVAIQKQLGLVRISSDCSGTLLNRVWVLTTDHCLAAGIRGGAPVPFQNVRVSGDWTVQATPTRFVRNWWLTARQLDIALMYLGNGDLGPANAQALGGKVDSSMMLTKYGRGRSTFASCSEGTCTRALADGLYRSGQFSPTDIGENGYTLSINSSKQIGHAGDSGGPDRITVASGPSTGNIGAIVGVQSTCHSTGYICGEAITGETTCHFNWNWAVGADSCYSAAIGPIAEEIADIIREGIGGVPCSARAAGCGILEPTRLMLLK